MSSQHTLTSTAGSAKVLWALATSPFPLTTREICDALGLDKTTYRDRSAVSQSLSTLHETGIVVRRQVPGTGAPYEYAANPEWTPEDHLGGDRND